MEKIFRGDDKLNCLIFSFVFLFFATPLFAFPTFDGVAQSFSAAQADQLSNEGQVLFKVLGAFLSGPLLLRPFNKVPEKQSVTKPAHTGIFKVESKTAS